MPLSCPGVDKEFGRLIPLQATDEENNTVSGDLEVRSLELDGISTCKGTTKTCTKGLFGWERLLSFFLYTCLGLARVPTAHWSCKRKCQTVEACTQTDKQTTTKCNWINVVDNGEGKNTNKLQNRDWGMSPSNCGSLEWKNGKTGKKSHESLANTNTNHEKSNERVNESMLPILGIKSSEIWLMTVLNRQTGTFVKKQNKWRMNWKMEQSRK